MTNFLTRSRRQKAATNIFLALLRYLASYFFLNLPLSVPAGLSTLAITAVAAEAGPPAGGQYTFLVMGIQQCPLSDRESDDEAAAADDDELSPMPDEESR